MQTREQEGRRGGGGRDAARIHYRSLAGSARSASSGCQNGCEIRERVRRKFTPSPSGDLYARGFRRAEGCRRTGNEGTKEDRGLGDRSNSARAKRVTRDLKEIEGARERGRLVARDGNNLLRADRCSFNKRSSFLLIRADGKRCDG